MAGEVGVAVLLADGGGLLVTLIEKLARLE